MQSSKVVPKKNWQFLSVIVALILLSSVAGAQETPEGQTIEVGGRTFQMTDVSYYPDGSVHTGQLIGEHSVAMARDNVLPLDGNQIWFDQDGHLTRVTQFGYFSWTMPDGSEILMDCRVRMQAGGKIGRIIDFYPNGEYSRGCDSFSQKLFVSEFYSVNVRYSSTLDLWADGSLKYASKVSSDSYVALKAGQRLFLNHHSEVALHENGQPRFFTLLPDYRLMVMTPNAGEIQLGTNPAARMAIILRPDGSVVTGGPREPVNVTILDEERSLSLEAAGFDSDGYLALMIFHPSQSLPADLRSRAIPLRGGRFALCMNRQNELVEESYCRQRL